jgi:hypothetical protein
MTTVSPFARSSAFDEPRLQSREQTVRIGIRDRISNPNPTPILETHKYR